MTFHMTSKRRQFAGFTLIELMVVLAIMSMIAIYAARRAKESAENSVAVASAENIKTLGEALEAYMVANTATLTAVAPPGPQPIAVTVASLQAAGTCGARPCLLSAFNPPAWMGGYDIRVTRIGPSAPYSFEALVCTVNPYRVDGSPRADLAGKVIQAGGGRFGMTYNIPPEPPAAHGSSGWVAQSADYPFVTVATKVCYFIPPAGGAGDIYLRRDGSNSMLGTLNMNSNAIAGATNVTATGAISGGTGAFTGAINASAGTFTGAVNAATGTYTGAVSANSVSAATTVSAGTNMTAGGNVNANNVVLNPNGTLSSTGALNIQSAAGAPVNMNTGAGAGNVVVGSVGGAANLQVMNDVNVTRNANVNNTVTATNDVVISTLTSRTNPLSSTSVKALLPNLVEINSIPLNNDGQSIPVPTCPNGGAARIFAIPQTVRGAVDAGNWGADIHIAGAVGGPWNFYARDANGVSLPPVAAPNFIALARIFCAY